MNTDILKIRSENISGSEISWFAPICDGDDRILGERSNTFKSNWENASQIVRRADKLGFRNILCPSSYQVGQDTMTFASAVAPLVEHINLLPAVRCGEIHPPMLAKAIATLDHILKGKLTLNIISSNLPGENLDSASRYQRSREVIDILKQAWNKDEINFEGQFYNLHLPAQPVKPYQQNGGPLLYFGGYSPAGVDLCAEHCDVYLLWPETKSRLQELMLNMSNKAGNYCRTVDFGLRIHVIVRTTETEARAAAQLLMSKVSEQQGNEIKDRALDSKSLGVSRQSIMRDISDSDGFVEDNLWTGIGKARSGCGAAIVGDPDQVYNKIMEYQHMGFRSFIFSGYPHLEACDLFGKYVLPRLETVSLSLVQNRIPQSEPLTPLGKANRI